MNSSFAFNDSIFGTDDTLSNALGKIEYKLDILINDEDFRVRKAVLIYCKEHIDNEKCKKILLLNKI